MTPEISKSKLERAKKAGAKVTTKPDLPTASSRRPKPEAKPIPEPSVDNSKVVDILEANTRAQAQQGEQIERLAQLISELVGPVRLRANRIMEPSDPRYLLIDTLDVIPVEIKRKLNS